MLSQHSVTKPVFDALFEDYSFASHNPVSIVMQECSTSSTGRTSSRSPRVSSRSTTACDGGPRASTTPRASSASSSSCTRSSSSSRFPRAAESLGIVYTPVEIVDFIVRSVESRAAYRVRRLDERPRRPCARPVHGDRHVYRPAAPERCHSIRKTCARSTSTSFTRTRSCFSPTTSPRSISRRRTTDSLGGKYEPFEGIVLTDTFQSSEAGRLDGRSLLPAEQRASCPPEASRHHRHHGQPALLGRPGSENDDNKNLAYPDTRREDPARPMRRSPQRSLKRNLYDSYVRAFRWASDRIGDRGVVCFVSNGSYIDTGSFDGFRKSLADEFTSVYCFNLRGNQRTSGETSRREGGKVFGQGSRTPVAITLLVQEPRLHVSGLHPVPRHRRLFEPRGEARRIQSFVGV